MARFLVLALALSLAGCAHQLAAPIEVPVAQPEPPKPIIKTVVKQTCIHWDKWSDGDLAALHDALVSVPDGSPIIKLDRDWKRYYDAAKACADDQK